ncbi:MAG: ABC transporter ATP-binding protein [Candidatus Aminicenantes bacterium]|nr:ABC transporter ATP-binding protein [Candidatus Aminicenantes bacterium]
MVRVIDLWKEYPQDGQKGTAALRGASLEVWPGEIVALLGKSGSGKTTLLNLIAGIDRPTKGRIEVEGRNLEALGETGRTQWRRLRLGFVFQFFNLLPTLTAFENVFLSLELIGHKDPRFALAALRDVGLEGKEQRYPNELSGGEQQRVAIARAIVKQPLLILADEPTGNLDTQTGKIVFDLLVGECRKRSTTMIMASHAALSRRSADRILRIVDGTIIEETPSADFEP